MTIRPPVGIAETPIYSVNYQMDECTEYIGLGLSSKPSRERGGYRPRWEIVAERNPKTLRRPQGASSGLLAAEGGVDEFAKRRRTALKGLRELQNCYVFP